MAFIDKIKESVTDVADTAAKKVVTTIGQFEGVAQQAVETAQQKVTEVAEENRKKA